MISVITAIEEQLDPAEMETMYRILIDAYAQTERKIWGENYVRISKDAFFELIKQQRILVARLDGKLVGSIYYYPISPGVIGFGLFSADLSLSGKGIGRTLIAEVEARARKEGAQQIKIELLRPRDFTLPFKERLKSWYQQLGYTLVDSQDFLTFKPKEAEKAKRLVTPSIFDIYVKSLK